MSQLQVTGEAKVRDIQGPVVANSGVITALDGEASQYVRGDGTLADFPTSTGGGSSVSYYLNSSVSQGTIGGVAYRQLSKTPISGAGTDITASTNGYIASYLTDANDPALLEVPAGNFNCEFYFSVNSNAHNPYVYAEVYKYDGTTFTLIGSSQSVPEYLTNGTTLSPYYFAIPVAQTVLAITDRIAIRIYVNVDGRTVTLHTENNHLCQVVTTFSKGLTSLNNLTRQVQFLATGTSGTDFGIVSSVATHTFNLPVASAANTGKLSSTDWSTFNGKYNLPSLTSGSVLFSNGTTIVQNNANFFWDNTNSFLGVGTNVPSAGITSFSSTPAFQFKAAGVAPAMTFSNTLTAATYAAVFGLATSNNQFIFGTATGDFAIANQSTSAGAIVFGTGTTEKMRMTSAGTFSIGNTNSTYNLDVTGTGRFTTTLTANKLVAGNASTDNVAIFTTYDEGKAIQLKSSTGDLLFVPFFNPLTGARIISQNTAGSAYNPLTIFASTINLTGGNVGIGISSPATKLDVSGTIRSIGQTDPTGGVGMELFYRAADTSSYIQSYDRTNGAWKDVKIYGSTLYFGTQGTNSLTINTSGNVGIGTSSPSANLHVNSNGETKLTISSSNPSGNSNVVLEMNGNFYYDSIIRNNSAGSIVFQSGTTERMRITSGDDVYVTRNADASRFGILNTKSGGNNWYLNSYSNGSLYLQINTSNLGVFDGTTGGYTPLSDVNKKKDFEESTIGLSAILGLKPTLYRMKTDETEGKKELGFIAQEVKEFIPQAYVESGDEDNKFIGLNYNPIVAALVKSVQELEARIKQLENK